ncbi:putative DDE superfamily endonuclease [Monocercomonoides exilis]|uniref:putative DDE superfamily endonuclease n=1 Tax=Monocercomonoides exilis TaxID=2049356 RepID=UPI00355A37E9|nr:putative DDE superfamily endonuclease [Monocercomonoides exilis]|eukprot:MONOS_16012.1-p1 / transcript=MONOS_16012.1 / gene=MONOS_16012 / organism=Monocercomonoides_exilis_PA203 / gene_product=unspecified product / transcript_product=unspecified product / location=Mono_scaffold01458:4496-5602(+) / protein_length=335 / sequence_SO=supercontig / SO=protein_coding / is_pseudo=false
MKDVGIVLDCTVIPICRPGGKLKEGKKFYSGKHHYYCVKVEVGVNPRMGTASTISEVYTGSTHDYSVFKEHYPKFQDKMEGSKILADSAYVGARPELGAVISKPVGTKEISSKRVIVERFFGRLKTLFSVFRHPWPFDVEKIGEYFFVACCLTNYHILQNPLTKKDEEANQRFLDSLVYDYLQKKEAKRIANERYNTKIKNKLNPGNMPAPRISSLGTQREGQTQNLVSIDHAISRREEEREQLESLREEERVCLLEREREREIPDTQSTDHSLDWFLPGQWKSTNIFLLSSSAPFPVFPTSSSSSSSASASSSSATHNTQILSPLQLLLNQRND